MPYRTQKFATRAVVSVGNGRGFVVRAGADRFVITAAHCIPRDRLPTPHLANSTSDLTFRDLIGHLAAKRRTVWGELCVFGLCDDVAVLGVPDSQELPEEHERFEKFTAAAMMIGTAPAIVESYKWTEAAGTSASVLSLNGEWRACKLHNGGRFLTLDKNANIEVGMSGSPIIDANGAAIGVISTGSSGFGENINPSLRDCLPQWLLRKLGRISHLTRI